MSALDFLDRSDPALELWAMAHFITVPIRCRTRRAVGGLLLQMGERTAMTAVVIPSARLLPGFRFRQVLFPEFAPGPG